MNKKPKAYNLEKIHKAVRNERKGYFKRDNGPHCWNVYFVGDQILGIKHNFIGYHPALVVAENGRNEVILMNFTHTTPQGKKAIGFRKDGNSPDYLVKELIARYDGNKTDANIIGRRLSRFSIDERKIKLILKEINKLPKAKEIYKQNKKSDT